MSDTIDRQAAIDTTWEEPHYTDPLNVLTEVRDRIKALPPAEPQYEELTPEEAAAEIAGESMRSTIYWLDATIRLKQMGYVICRKR